MANTAQIDVAVAIQDSKVIGGANYTAMPKITASIGLSSAQAAKRYIRTVTTAGTTDYDVTSGLVDAYGTALVYATVNAVVIYNSGSATLTVGAGTHPLFGSDLYTIKAGQILIIPNVPITVSGTVNNIHVVPTASTTWQIAILGA